MGMFRIKLISTMNHSNDYDTYVYSFLSKTFNFFNNRFLRKKGMASTLKMEYQVFLYILQKNSAMATFGLKEMRKFLWEGRLKRSAQLAGSV